MPLEKGVGEDSTALADRASRAAIETAEGLLFEAEESVKASVGLRLYQPAKNEENPKKEPSARWTPIDAESDLAQRVVVLIHGLDEPGDVWMDLAPALAEVGRTAIRFDYPNDQRIARSADLLIASLRRLRRLGIERVDLVTHSMGGLVARDALTRMQSDSSVKDIADAEPERGEGAGESTRPRSAREKPKNKHPSSPAPLPEGEGGGRTPAIGRLILVAPPNHGAPLAHFRVALEAGEQFRRLVGVGPDGPPHAFRFLSDGGGEAGEDLLPGSDFLTDLNSRPLPENTRITIIVAHVVPPNSNLLDRLFNSPLAGWLFGDDADEAADEARDLLDFLGDGVMPSESALLKGVDDIVHLQAFHRSMLKPVSLQRVIWRTFGADPGPPPAIPVILDRLNDDRPN